MKAVVAIFFAVAAAASAGVVIPETYSYGLGFPSPLAYSAPLVHTAPLAYSTSAIVAAPAIKSGYVAANRGAIHEAPLPEGPHAFSHHLNIAPAPGSL